MQEQADAAEKAAAVAATKKQGQQQQKPPSRQVGNTASAAKAGHERAVSSPNAAA